MNSSQFGGTRLGMVRCEHCQRQFNPHSAARHIPWCKKQQSDAKKRRLTADKLEALERYRWRIGYRPTNKLQQRTSIPRKVSSESYPSEEQEEEIEQRGGGRLTRTGHRDSQSNNYNNRTAKANSHSSSVNSTATLSSPSASSLTSLSASIASANGQASTTQTNKQLDQSKGTSRPFRRPSGVEESKQHAASLRDKLKRSVSSMTLAKQRNTGSASSRNSRISTTTMCVGKTLETDKVQCERQESQMHLPFNNSRQHQQQTQPVRAKSVSDLTSMGEIVETLAKKMEEIYAQNQLLLNTLLRTKRMNGSAKNMNRCDNNEAEEERKNACDDDVDDNDDDDDDGDDVDDDEVEFALCHHCRARCSIEANYCHKCGCKMRPSNPTPSEPD